MPRLALRETRHERRITGEVLYLLTRWYSRWYPPYSSNQPTWRRINCEKGLVLSHTFASLVFKNAIPLSLSFFLPLRLSSSSIVYDLCLSLFVSLSLSDSVFLRGDIVAVKRRNNDKSVSAEEEKEFLVVARGSNLPPSFETGEEGDIIVSLRVLVDFVFNRKWLSDAFYRR